VTTSSVPVSSNIPGLTAPRAEATNLPPPNPHQSGGDAAPEVIFRWNIGRALSEIVGGCFVLSGEVTCSVSGAACPGKRPPDFKGHATGATRFVTRIVSFLPLLLSPLLTGCLKPEPAPDLVIINGNEPESLDPAIVTGLSEMRITKALFEGLVRLDPKKAQPIPGLAERWEVSPDGRVYTFYLRTNAAWSTGEPITTEDVLYSWLRALSPATAGDYAGQLFYIKNAEDYYTEKSKT